MKKWIVNFTTLRFGFALMGVRLTIKSPEDQNRHHSKAYIFALYVK